MINIIYLILSFYIILSYLRGRYVSFIVSLFMLLSNGFNLLPVGNVKIGDYGLLICVVLLLVEFKKNRHLFACSGDNIGKLIILLISYFLFCVVLSIIRQKESAFYSMLIFRFDLFYLSYFIFRKIDNKSIEKGFQYLLFISVIGGVLYYLQFVGITGILQTGSDMSGVSSSELARLRNTPYLTTPVLFYLLISPQKIRCKNILIVFFCGLIILPMNRGGIISSLLVIGIYFTLKGEIGLKHIFFVALVFLLFQPILSYRFSNNGSTGDGVLNELKTSVDIVARNEVDGYDNSVIYNNGTFVFRVLLVAERFGYLSNSLTNLFLGAGTIHESSPNIKKYFFSVGTTTHNDDGSLEMHQIDTNDVAFITHLFRFGLIYLFIFLWFLIVSLKRLYRSSEPLCITAFLFLFAKVVQSLGSDGFSSFESMVFILLILPLSITQSKIKI